MLTYEKFAHPWISREVVGFSKFRGEDFTRGKGKNQGLGPPLELCFGTSEIECSAS